MKKFVLSILAFTFVCCLSTVSNAKVMFLATDDTSVGAEGVGSGDCDGNGYKYSTGNCNGGLAEPCPTNPTYFKVCCPAGYTHTKEECVANAKPLSTDNCHGFYKCD